MGIKYKVMMVKLPCSLQIAVKFDDIKVYVFKKMYGFLKYNTFQSETLPKGF